MGGGMGFGGWSRFRRWLKNRVYAAVWPIVRSRIFVKLKSIVSKCIVPVSWCGIGAAIGAGAAFALAFPPGYGALIGLAATGGAFGLTMLYNKVFPPQRTSRFIGVFRTQRVSVILIHSTTNYIREFFTFLCRREQDNSIPPSALMWSPTRLNMPVSNGVWWAKVRNLAWTCAQDWGAWFQGWSLFDWVESSAFNFDPRHCLCM